MKRIVGLVAVVMVALGLPSQAGAQESAAAGQPVSDAIRTSWESAKKNMRDSAEAVPEALYSFSPVPKVVRTFGEIIAHTAGANYVFCSAARGEKSPHEEAAFESLTAKAAIMKVWDESVASCDAAFKALSDRTAGETIEMPFGMGKGARTAALIGNIGHLNEHYGNLVTYMRMKEIVPPTSRGR